MKNNLKQIRIARNLQQNELGAAVKTDARTISRYETGKRCPSLEMALRISAYLGVGIGEIFELDEVR